MFVQFISLHPEKGTEWRDMHSLTIFVTKKCSVAMNSLSFLGLNIFVYKERTSGDAVFTKLQPLSISDFYRVCNATCNLSA